MRQLILLRHGKAESVSASGGDFERGLTDRGRRDAGLIARTLAEAGLTPDLALVSPARRALETWEAASASFPGARMELAPGLYQASVEDIEAVVDAQGGAAQVVMVVGHNPGLHEYARELTAAADRRARDGQRLADSFPTAAAAVFLTGDDGAVLQRLLLPRDIGGGA